MPKVGTEREELKMPAPPHKLRQATMRFEGETGDGFSVYVSSPLIRSLRTADGSCIDLDLTESSGWIVDQVEDCPFPHDPLRGVSEGLRGVGLWFGTLTGPVSSEDRAVSAEVARLLAGALRSSHMFLRVTFPDGVRSYEIANSRAVESEVTMNVALRVG